LADEINRAPAKVQSALLEAMAERQITVGSTTYKLPPLFLVMATQNPLEQEGTYALPEAQLDRFLMHVEIDYPDAATEHKILALTRSEAIRSLEKKSPLVNQNKLTQENIAQARTDILKLHVSEAAETYLVQLIMATRHPEKYDADLAQWIEIGASPRATIALERCARAHAWLHQRDFVSPEDIQAVLGNVLRHRLIYSYHAQAQGVTSSHVIEKILALVPVP
jgi:MoxR-like ATPase